jgi:XTP/dITP diphosphohydrolase
VKLYAATANAGKLRDFAAAAQAYNCDLAPLPNLSKIPAPAEDGQTFAENARAKALYYAAQAPGLAVVADDSGLEVDALDGAPGVRSARFAADAGISPATDNANNEYLLQRLRNAPTRQRNARYKCALAAAIDNCVIAESEGSVEGIILTAPRGVGGFGYDPLFFLRQLNKAMAEVDLETKLRLSHRGAALRNLLAMLFKISSSTSTESRIASPIS